MRYLIQRTEIKTGKHFYGIAYEKPDSIAMKNDRLNGYSVKVFEIPNGVEEGELEIIIKKIEHKS